MGEVGMMGGGLAEQAAGMGCVSAERRVMVEWALAMEGRAQSRWGN